MDVKEAINILESSVSLGVNSEAVKLAVRQLNKLIPRKPIESWHLGCSIALCPNCKSVVYDADWDVATQRKYFLNHCLVCCQRFTPKTNHLGEWESKSGESDKT